MLNHDNLTERVRGSNKLVDCWLHVSNETSARGLLQSGWH